MSSVLISAEDLIKSYYHGLSGSKNIVLTGSSLTINSGETVGLTGPSGCGKSTFGRILAGLENPDNGLIRYKSEVFSRDGQQYKCISRRKIQILFQDPGGTFNPVRSLGSSLEQVIRMPGIYLPNGGIAAVLHEVGLHGEILSRFPQEISGGQAQRLALARILLVKPELIILDEPSSALDLSVQAQILHLLKKIRIKENISYLFISHDQEVLRFMCDRITSMESGKIISVMA